MAEHNFADFERADLLELIFSVQKIGKTVEVHVEVRLAKVIFEMMLMFWRPTRWMQ